MKKIIESNIAYTWTITMILFFDIFNRDFTYSNLFRFISYIAMKYSRDEI